MRKYMNNPFGQSRIFRTRIRFAVDPDATNDGTNGTEDVHVDVGGGSSESTNDADENDVSIEALKAELAQAKAEVTRFKNTNDKLLKEKGELTKKAREMMSADQKEKEAQEERDKRFAELEKELRTNKYSKRLVGIGMTEADADAFATMMPELEDADAFFNAFQTFVQAKEKAAGDKAIQDLLKSRPDINAGHGDSDKDDPAMAFAKASVEANKHRNATVNQDILKNYM